MYILIHSSINNFPINLPDTFIQINIREIYSAGDNDDHLYRINEEEYYLNKISKLLDKAEYRNVKAIVIDKYLGFSGWGRAINLAGHIICTDYSNCTINKVPIILSDWESVKMVDPSLKDIAIDNIFQTDGVYFRKYEEVFSKCVDNSAKSSKYVIEDIAPRLKSPDYHKISVRSVYDSYHQATNEWGAMRLASNFGVLDKIKFVYPQHLYFKYLSKYINKTTNFHDTSLYKMFNNILLIDDNAEYGWMELLRYIHDCQIEKRGSAEELHALMNTKPEMFKLYDLIYLDLYLVKGELDNTSALSILKLIKKKYPHIPVVIFTASDKAWNLNETKENGADAMYIKESPIYYRDEKYSLRNYDSFKNSLIGIYNKYRILRPYWKAIINIVEDSSFFEIQETNSSKFKDRIKERFEMFYGLLKLGLEQNKFNESRFHFTYTELAFVTLWSVLNELSEAYYTKTQPNITLSGASGEEIGTHPNGHNLTYARNHYKWVIKGQHDVFIEYDYELRDNGSSNVERQSSPEYFKLKHNQTSYFLYSNNQFSIGDINKTKINYETTLYMQIAFLIERKENLCNNVNKIEYQKNLVRLNEIRNHLYLTHGSDISTGFHDQTEKDKRSNHNIKPDEDIKVLFELISFILTGKENLVNF